MTPPAPAPYGTFPKIHPFWYRYPSLKTKTNRDRENNKDHNWFPANNRKEYLRPRHYNGRGTKGCCDTNRKVLQKVIECFVESSSHVDLCPAVRDHPGEGRPQGEGWQVDCRPRSRTRSTTPSSSSSALSSPSSSSTSSSLSSSLTGQQRSRTRLTRPSPPSSMQTPSSRCPSPPSLKWGVLFYFARFLPMMTQSASLTRRLKIWGKPSRYLAITICNSQSDELKRESNFFSFRSFIVATLSELITSGGDKKHVSSFMFIFCCQISAVCSFAKKNLCRLWK